MSDALRASLQADVAHLAAMVRDSAGPGERASATWIAHRLREAGAADVVVQPFRYQGTYAWAHAAHAAVGLAGGWAAVAGLVSLELDVSGRRQWLRRVLPGGQGANVVARVPAAPGRRRGTLVLVAHHDAARTGLVWHPRVAALGAGSRRRLRRIPGYQLPTAVGLALAALPSRAARAGGRALLVASIAADLDIARSPTVPGASDNATGVAALLWLAGQVSAPHVETLLVATGCEESGMGGMAAFLRAHREELGSGPVLVLSLDTLGAGTPIVCSGEGTIREHRYRPVDLALADAGAARAGEAPPERWRIGGWTDPILARFAGLPAISLLSIGPDGGFTNYHLPSDTPERVDWGSAERCTRIAAGIAAAFAATV